ncbi:hypothetical protein ACF3NT_12700 [Naumannella halotolerans]|uniref:hypothetical protein n=1 Tax=Naumannella halotolerans TaxID=993414 RepID=UPI00370DDEC1
MRTLRSFWHQLYDLAVTTVVVWWRLLPTLLLIQILSWTSFAISQHIGALVSAVSIWLAIALLAMGFVAILIGYVISLRMVGAELRIDDLAPDSDENGRRSVIDLLAATLLPFLGIYGVFQYVQNEAGQMFLLADIMYGGVFSDVDLLGPIDPTRGPAAFATVLGVLVGIYIVRRGLDLVHERTGRPVLGLITAFLEATFLLVIIFGGQRLISRARFWWEDREFHTWIELGIQGLARSLEPLRIDLPEILQTLGSWLSILWGLFLGGTVEPLLWLAVAALVFGTHVLSLAELWRKVNRSVRRSYHPACGNGSIDRTGPIGESVAGSGWRSRRLLSVTSTTAICRPCSRSGW